MENEAEIVFGMVLVFDIQDMQPRGRPAGHMHFEELQKVNRYRREMEKAFLY